MDAKHRRRLIILTAAALSVIYAHRVRNTAPAVEHIFFSPQRVEVWGHGLGKVEVWEIPTGTGITESDHRKLGDAKAAGDYWTLAVDECPLATDVFVRVYDTQGKQIGQDAYLPYHGASAIYDHFCKTSRK